MLLTTKTIEGKIIPYANVSSIDEAQELIQSYLKNGWKKDWPAPDYFEVWQMGDGPATVIKTIEA